ncbi:unnamed protein product, partial [Anisakis simplex]|uniref:DDE_Tnp_1_7 domain-containing protein n=1 Tax=Anisakis simplex TaxID=6269 RepID=A0A0M3JIA8_ANISI
MCPLNGSDSKYDNPPYQTYSVYKYRLWNQDVTKIISFRVFKAYLSSKTLCMLGTTKIGKMYDMKNMYGLLESIATQKALHQLMSKRSVVITRSSFPSGGRYAGHWLGDNYAAWND